MQKWRFLKYFYLFHPDFLRILCNIQKQVVNNIYHHLIQIFLPPFSLAKKPQRDLQITAYYYTLHSLSVFLLAKSLQWILEICTTYRLVSNLKKIFLFVTRKQMK